MKIKVAVLFCVALAGCGNGGTLGSTSRSQLDENVDYTSNFTGTWSGSYTVTISPKGVAPITDTYDTALQIRDGDGLNDLLLMVRCGVPAHASNDTAFVTFQNDCTLTDEDNHCRYTYKLEAGRGSRSGRTISMSNKGTVSARCDDGFNDTADISITYSLTRS